MALLFRVARIFRPNHTERSVCECMCMCVCVCIAAVLHSAVSLRTFASAVCVLCVYIFVLPMYNTKSIHIGSPCIVRLANWIKCCAYVQLFDVVCSVQLKRDDDGDDENDDDDNDNGDVVSVSFTCRWIGYMEHKYIQTHAHRHTHAVRIKRLKVTIRNTQHELYWCANTFTLGEHRKALAHTHIHTQTHKTHAHRHTRSGTLVLVCVVELVYVACVGVYGIAIVYGYFSQNRFPMWFKQPAKASVATATAATAPNKRISG